MMLNTLVAGFVFREGKGGKRDCSTGGGRCSSMLIFRGVTHGSWSGPWVRSPAAFKKARGSSQLGREMVFRLSRVESARVWRWCSKSQGSGRFGSHRVGSDRVGSDRVGSGRVGSGRFGSGRVGSGRARRFSNITGRGPGHPR